MADKQVRSGVDEISGASLDGCGVHDETSQVT